MTKNALQLLISFLLLLSISYALARIWRSIFSGKKYSIIVFPGVILHELSHLFACLITLAKVKKVKLFSFKGGYVIHKKPKVPLIGAPIISFFPVLGGIFFLFFIYKITGFQVPQPELSFEFLVEIKDYFSSNKENYIFWIIIYLSASVLISMTPSKKDIQNSIFNLLIIFVIFLILVELGLVKNLSGLNWMIGAIWFSLFIGFSILIFSIPVYLIKFILLKLIRK